MSSKGDAIRTVIAAAAAVAVLGCAEPPKPKPAPVYSERIVLLPNKDGRDSAVIVKRATGDQRISTPYEAVDLVGSKESRNELAQEEVEKRYGGVLEAQPARPFTYTLYFTTGTTELTAASRQSLNEVRSKIKGFPAAQVTVTGHTDRVGGSEANDALSLKRAAAIRDLLVRIGIPRDAIEVVGRGEREPVVQTADGVAEERNRRVEIKLR
ncbi:MAG TPA: OmpA family protein [Burkholderiales bacterium]|nr:OmpA family protein [Burkholderiales bacterium]